MQRHERLLPSGTVVDRYVIERPIGSGAMGDVYAARDTKLSRTVAIKVLPEASAGDPGRVKRFLREAELASALNHPAIVSVFDAVSPVLVMELVEGRTLREWAGDTRDLARIATVMAAVADGLACAHAAGIVHRDLKPENILVARGDLPKIVDFGVAKLTERLPGASCDSDTMPSAAIGTPAYMAPEQVNGGGVDGRTDVFAFGCVLYELLTGRSPFLRDTPVETMHAVLHDTPAAPRTLRRDLPPSLDRIVRRCLAPDPDERYQSIKDAALDLREFARGEAVETAERRGSRRRYAGVAAAIVLAFVLLIVIRNRDVDSGHAFAGSPPLAERSMVRLTNGGNVTAGAISPDGKVFAYATDDGATQTLWVKQIATGTTVRVIPPERVYYEDVAVSPDGNYIYYGLSRPDERNVVDLMQLPLLGGERRRIVHDFDNWFAVSSDGKRVAFRRMNATDRIHRLFVADIDSGEEQLILTRAYPNIIGALAWRPDGTRITFVDSSRNRNWKSVISEINPVTHALSHIATPAGWSWLGPLAWLPDGNRIVLTVYQLQQSPQIWLLDTQSGKGHKITSDISNYPSLSVTSDGQSLLATRCDFSMNIWTTSLQRPGVARAMTSGLGNRYGGGGVRWTDAGEIVFTTEFGGHPPALVAIPAHGGPPRQLARGGSFWSPALSPDGKRLAFVSDRSGTPQIWTSAVDGSDARQLTHDGLAAYPSWMPDGRSLVYVTIEPKQAICRIDANGGEPERLTDGPGNFPLVSPDGKWLLCRLRAADGQSPLWRTALLPIGVRAEPRFFDIPHDGRHSATAWLPDGSGFAFTERTSGVDNIWVQPIDGSSPRQLTHLDSGEIANLDIDRKGRVAFVRVLVTSDLVAISDFAGRPD